MIKLNGSDRSLTTKFFFPHTTRYNRLMILVSIPVPVEVLIIGPRSDVRTKYVNPKKIVLVQRVPSGVGTTYEGPKGS